MKKISLLLAFLGFIGLQVVFAQTRNITGSVTSADDGSSIPGTSVIVKGTTLGTVTDMDGKFSLKIPATAKALMVTFVGMQSQEVAIGNQTTINIKMTAERLDVDEVVVTALGISREKKSLGYASQSVKGDEIATVKSSNFMNSLSGKVSGVQIKKNTNMGGSTNVVLRGSKSLNNSNQVLYVVDGVPINNQIGSATGQNTGGVGYDYGNAASDINADDIESVNVLKGSAATALYGSRASGGVIMIVTKKGSAGKKGMGITVNSNYSFSSIDKSTFPTYQDQYGAGYGAYYGPDEDAFFEKRNATGGSTGTLFDWVPMTEDASYGGKFDGHPVYGWYSVDKESPWYGQPKPWQAAKNGPITFFEKPYTTTNTISIDNATDKGSVRLSYTNYDTKGLMPNSSLKKNNFLVNGAWTLTDRLNATVSANYTRQEAIGRNSTGYNDNIVSGMRQWWETNADIKDLKDIYDLTKRNISWNYGPSLSGVPIYWDNPYWTRFQNYETDSRNRFIGNMAFTYKITNWLEAFGRVSADSYSEIQEERRAVGSLATTFGVSRTNQKSGYLRRDITFSEYNYDFMLNFNKNLGTDFNLKGILGSTYRKTKYATYTASTNGGLNVPGIYSLQNSTSALVFPIESNSIIGVRGLYVSASLSYKSMLYLDATFRQDYASTLPVKNNKYYYPSVTGAFIFSETLKQDWLSFGKVRLNYAQVGNLAGYDQLLDKYTAGTPFNGPIYALPSVKNNADLKSESTTSIEGGLEMKFLKNRVGFDIAVYKTNSKDQIMPVSLSQTTGYSAWYVNAGEIENKGIEVSLNLIPVQMKSFRWDLNLNFSTNRNEVVSLYPGIDNLLLGSFQGGVTLNAQVGQPYGVLKGTNYTYDANGEIIINAANGLPKKTNSASVIGNVNPKWMGGIQNSFTYKNLTLSFLIDIQKGGSIYNLDMYYGMSSGLYPETAGLNDLGNPVRDGLVFNKFLLDKDGIPTTTGDPSGGYKPESGGYFIPGVNVANGVSTPNKTRIDATTSDAWGYAVQPNRAFVYDAGYVKLREVSISYTLPVSLVAKVGLKGAVLSAVGSNLWIISKHLPYADPESGLAAGNVQGYSIGSLPSTRDFGFNIKLNF